MRASTHSYDTMAHPRADPERRVKTIHDTPTPSARSLVPALWAILIAAIFLLSVLALLQIRVGAYDDSIFLLGARLVRGGRLPYIDFYTHYGPLGYTLVAAGSRISRNPGLALRILQAAFLAATLLLLLAMTRKKPNSIVAPLGLGGAAFGAFAAANVFRSAAFLGFSFCFAALSMAVLSRIASSTVAARLATVAGGVAVVCAGLVRPVFAAYAGVAIAAIEVAEKSGARNRHASRRALLFVGAASVALCVIWITLYPRIPPVVAFEASVLVPGRLVGGGERFLNPRFLLSPTGAGLAAFGAVLAGGLVAAASACWTLAARSSSTRTLVALAGVAAALGTARLEGSSNPGLETALLSGVLLLVACRRVPHAHGDCRVGADRGRRCLRRRGDGVRPLFLDPVRPRARRPRSGFCRDRRRVRLAPARDRQAHLRRLRVRSNRASLSPAPPARPASGGEGCASLDACVARCDSAPRRRRRGPIRRRALRPGQPMCGGRLDARAHLCQPGLALPSLLTTAVHPVVHLRSRIAELSGGPETDGERAGRLGQPGCDRLERPALRLRAPPCRPHPENPVRRNLRPPLSDPRSPIRRIRGPISSRSSRSLRRFSVTKFVAAESCPCFGRVTMNNSGLVPKYSFHAPNQNLAEASS